MTSVASLKSCCDDDVEEREDAGACSAMMAVASVRASRDPAGEREQRLASASAPAFSMPASSVHAA